jgi:hypothetical protein
MAVLLRHYDRKYDLGEAVFRHIVARFVPDPTSVQECWEERTSSRDQYRREITYIAKAWAALGIDLDSITTAQAAQQAVLHGLRWLDENTTHSADVLQHVKSSACVMFAYNGFWPSLTPSRVIRAALKRIRRGNPSIRKPLSLNWEFKELWLYLRSLPPPDKLLWNQLLGSTIILTRTMGRLRQTELERLDAEEDDPGEDGWWFQTIIKLHEDPEMVFVPALRELALDPVRHLLEVRKRIRQKRTQIRCMPDTSFWMDENGRKLSRVKIVKLTTDMMTAAGIVNPHAKNLKHAAVTALHRAGMPAEEIVAYARHKQGTTTWKRRYLDTAEARVSVQKLASLK